VGYVDRWIGDCINHPNNETKHQWQLNSFDTYYRLNGGEWVNDREIGRDIYINLQQFREEFSADEIWDITLKETLKNDK